MSNHEISFVLNNNEKIFFEINDLLSEVHCCYDVRIFFIHYHEKFLLNDDAIRESMYALNHLLTKALKNELQLDKSLKMDGDLKKNIGYLWHEEIQKQIKFWLGL